MNFNFAKEFRLRAKNDFKALRLNSVAHHTKFFNIYYADIKPGSPSRIGLSVSKKCGNAVARNFLKRKIRENFRKSNLKFKGLDLLVNLKPAINSLPREKSAQVIDILLVQAFDAISFSR